MDNFSMKLDTSMQMNIYPQLLQSMAILQMNSQELLEYIRTNLEENPLLEELPDPFFDAEGNGLCQVPSRLSAGMPEGAGEAPAEYGVTDQETESLTVFLEDQLERLHLDAPMLSLCRYLVQLLDENGWLDQADLDSLPAMGVPKAMAGQALELVQSLEPAGVGACTLSQCLLLQLKRQKKLPAGVKSIVTRFLPELGQKRYALIARELKLTREQVQRAAEYIAALEPHPGKAFQQSKPEAYIRPDIFVVKRDGRWEAVINEYLLPRVTINRRYLESQQEFLDQEAREYLRQKLCRAQALMDGLTNRQNLLCQTVQMILKEQIEFFEGTTQELMPMSLTVLAARLSAHPSTASRAIRGKYLQCQQGVFPLRYFFSRSAGGSGCSQQTVKHRISQLIGTEDHSRPLSDPKLCALLAEQGIELSRRVVTKYRIQLGIPDFRLRKQE